MPDKSMQVKNEAVLSKMQIPLREYWTLKKKKKNLNGRDSF